MKVKAILYLIIASAVLFCIPYFFNDMGPTQSVSYMVGFNNRIAFIILVLCSLVPLYWGVRQSSIIELNVWKKRSCHIDKVVYKTLLIIILILIGTGILFSAKDFYGFAEDRYFLHYVYAVEHGAKLYDDIQFIYGPLCVYPIVFLDLIGITSSISYYIVLAFFHSIGLLLAWYVLSRLELSGKETKVLFIIIAVITFPYAMGLNNCVLRYTLAPSLLIFYIFDYQKKNAFMNTIWAILFSFIALMYSPEIGLCYVFASLFWLVSSAIVKKQFSYLYTFSGIVLFLVVLLASYPEYLSSVIQAGAGGANFPFIPSLILLLLFLVVFTTSFFVGYQLPNFKKNIDALGIELLLLSFVTASVGRCDPPHIITFCLFLIVISYIVLRSMYPLKRVAFIFIICLFSFFPYQGYTMVSFIKQSIKSNLEFVSEYSNSNYLGTGVIKKHLDEYIARTDYTNNALDSIYGTVSSIALENGTYLYLLDNKDYRFTYFEHTPQWIGGKKGFDKEIQSLYSIDAEFLVLPSNYRESWLSSNDYSIINLLFFTFYPIEPFRFYNKDLYGDLLCYIDNYYSEISHTKNVVILKKKI